MSQFQDLYAKVLTDAEFRTKLVSAPEDTLKSVGITPTPEILTALNNVMTAVSALGKGIDGEFPPADAVIGDVA